MVGDKTYLEFAHVLEDLFGIFRHHRGVIHVRFVHKYIPDGLDLTAVSFSTLRGCLWPDILGMVIVGLIFVLDHRLDLSNGVHELPRTVVLDFFDVHALFVVIFDDWGGKVGDLWDALGDADRRGAGRDRLDGL